MNDSMKGLEMKFDRPTKLFVKYVDANRIVENAPARAIIEDEFSNVTEISYSPAEAFMYFHLEGGAIMSIKSSDFISWVTVGD